MIRFTLISGTEEKPIKCGSHCPAMKFFNGGGLSLEVPDVYDDYFRRYSSERYRRVQEKGIEVMSGEPVTVFWGYLMDTSVYVGNQIVDSGMVESYENARQRIEEVESELERKMKKKLMVARMADVHNDLKVPGENVDSVKSFGSFLHLLISGVTEYLNRSNAKIEICQEGDPESEEQLAPFENFLNNSGS